MDEKNVSFIKVFLDLKDPTKLKRVKYVFSQISHIINAHFINIYNFSEANDKEILIYYGQNEQDIKGSFATHTVIIPDSEWLGNHEGTKRKQVPSISGIIKYKGRNMPIWYDYYELENLSPIATYESGACAVGFKKDRVYFGFDVLMCIFHLLSCQEEYLISKRDKFGRFLGTYSPRSKDNFLEQPTVNYYVMLLRQAIEGTLSINKREYPYPHFYVLLSHDVDNISSKGFWILSAHVYRLFRLMYHLDPKIFLRQLNLLLGKVFSPSNDYWNFETYVGIEKNHNAKSTFYFITGRKGRYGARYNLNEVKNVIHYLHESGCDIGLHTNFYSYHNWRQTKREKADLEDIIGHRIVGSRSHYLRFNIPYNWRSLIKAGIKYDSSLGYPDTVGFRAGIAYPFFPYDLERDEILPIIEIPLVIMDNALFEVLGLTKRQAIETGKRMIDRVAEVNGIITILWHSEALCDRDFPGWGEVYEEILSYVDMKGGKFITEEEALELIRNPTQ